MYRKKRKVIQLDNRKFEQLLRSWGAYHITLQEIPSQKAGTRAKECEGTYVGELDACALNSTERNGGALIRFARNHPLEARVERIVQRDLLEFERQVLKYRYTIIKRNGDPLGAKLIAQKIPNMNYRQVEYALKKARQKIRQSIS